MCERGISGRFTAVERRKLDVFSLVLAAAAKVSIPVVVTGEACSDHSGAGCN